MLCRFIEKHNHDRKDASPITHVWIDLFQVVQADVGGDKTWIQDFKEAVPACTRLLAIFSPWQDPEYVRRSWCVYEMLCALNAPVPCPVEIVMPGDAVKPFVEALLTDSTVVGKVMSKVRSKNMQAAFKSDRDEIERLIEESVGFHRLDTLLLGQMRKWMSAAATHVRKSVKDEDATDHLAHAEFLRSVGALHEHLGDFDRALEHYTDAQHSLEKGGRPRQIMGIELLVRIGNLYRKQGQFAKALRQHLMAEKLVARAFEGEDVDLTDDLVSSRLLASVHAHLGNSKKEINDFDGAMVALKKGLQIRLECKHLGPNCTDTADSHNDIGCVLHKLKKYSEALQHYMEAMEIRVAKFGRDHSETAMTYNNIAAVYEATDEFTKAIHWYQEATLSYEKTVGVEHPETATAYRNVGNVLARSPEADLDSAVQYHRKSVAAYSKSLGPHPDTAQAHMNVGGVLLQQGKADESIHSYKTALEIVVATVGAQHMDAGRVHRFIGQSYKLKKDYTSALTHFKQALSIFAAGNAAATGLEVARTCSTIGNVLYSRDEGDDLKSCVQWHSRALEGLIKHRGPTHPETAQSYLNIAASHSMLGQNAEGLVYYGRALVATLKSPSWEHAETAATAYRNLGNKFGLMSKAPVSAKGFGDGTSHKFSDLEAIYAGYLEWVVDPAAAGRKYTENVGCWSVSGASIPRHFVEGVYQRLSNHAYLQELIVLKRHLGASHPTITAKRTKIIQNGEAAADLYTESGIAKLNGGNVAGAVADFSEALTLREQSGHFGPDAEETGESHNNLGLAFSTMASEGLSAAVVAEFGDLRIRALEHFKEALRIKEAACGVDHPSTAGTLFNFGRVHLEQEQFQVAVQCFVRALNISEKHHGMEHPMTAQAHLYVGMALAEGREFTSAFDHLQACKGIVDKIPNHPLNAAVDDEIAQASKRAKIPHAHWGYVCDGCGMKPIIGTRFTREADDSDLCEADANKLSTMERTLYTALPALDRSACQCTCAEHATTELAPSETVAIPDPPLRMGGTTLGTLDRACLLRLQSYAKRILVNPTDVLRQQISTADEGYRKEIAPHLEAIEFLKLYGWVHDEELQAWILENKRLTFETPSARAKSMVVAIDSALHELGEPDSETPTEKGALAAEQGLFQPGGQQRLFIAALAVGAVALFTGRALAR